MIAKRVLPAALLVAACGSSPSPTSGGPDAAPSADADPAHPACASAMPARRLLYWEAPETQTQPRISLAAVNLAAGEPPCVVELASSVTDDSVVASATPSGHLAAFETTTSTTLIDLSAPAPALGATFAIAYPPSLRASGTGTDLDEGSSLFSPDGRWLAEVAPHELRGVAIGADGTAGTLQDIGSAGGWSTWSPSGDRVLEIDSGPLRVIDPTAGTTTSWPYATGRQPYGAGMWSPDGRWIAVITVGASTGDPGQVLLADTAHPERGLLAAGPTGDSQTAALDWSPDGKEVAVAVNDTIHVIAVGDTAPVDRFQLPSVSSEARFLDDDHVLTFTSGTTLAIVDASGATRSVSTSGVPWMVSPDRKTIALDTIGTVTLVTASTGAMVSAPCVTSGDDNGGDAAWGWSPDGGTFACLDTTTRGHLMTIATGVQQEIDLAAAGATTGPFAPFSYVSYSADGGGLLFVRGNQAFVIDPAAATAQAVPLPYTRSVAWAVP